MKKSRFTKSQIVAILKQADAGILVKDICRQAGISIPTYYQWKSKYGGLEASDLKPEFLDAAFVAWAKAHGMAIQYIQPGKPNQNAYIERFNRTFREEVLDQHLFARLQDVREAASWWQIEYNEERPHCSLGDLPPLE
jgi:transposase InsO family protein